jgi:hypothetical protein
VTDVLSDKEEKGLEGYTPPTSNTQPTRKKTFLENLQPWSKINPNASLFNLFVRPWPLIVYPAVTFSFLTFATTLGWQVCVNNTYASVFQTPPYNMTPGISTLLKVPALIGITLGTYCGGALADRYAEWQARKNNGVFEPEYRLVALILPFLIVPAGCLM